MGQPGDEPFPWIGVAVAAVPICLIAFAVTAWFVWFAH